MYIYIGCIAPQNVTSHVSNCEFLVLTHNISRMIISGQEGGGSKKRKTEKSSKSNSMFF
jgi:hypothetical protein